MNPNWSHDTKTIRQMAWTGHETEQSEETEGRGQGGSFKPNGNECEKLRQANRNLRNSQQINRNKRHSKSSPARRSHVLCGVRGLGCDEHDHDHDDDDHDHLLRSPTDTSQVQMKIYKIANWFNVKVFFNSHATKFSLNQIFMRPLGTHTLAHPRTPSHTHACILMALTVVVSISPLRPLRPL